VLSFPLDGNTVPLHRDVFRSRLDVVLVVRMAHVLHVVVLVVFTRVRAATSLKRSLRCGFSGGRRHGRRRQRGGHRTGLVDELVHGGGRRRRRRRGCASARPCDVVGVRFHGCLSLVVSARRWI